MTNRPSPPPPRSGWDGRRGTAYEEELPPWELGSVDWLEVRGLHQSSKERGRRRRLTQGGEISAALAGVFRRIYTAAGG